MSDYSFQLILGLIGMVNGLGVILLSGVYKKISYICAMNSKDHEELFNARREIEKDIEGIHQIHKIKGCDLPIRGRK